MLLLLPLYTEKNVFPLKLLQWVKDRASETQDNKHVIGQNLSEAEALFSEHQELEAKLKVRSPPLSPSPPVPSQIHPSIWWMRVGCRERWTQMNLLRHGARTCAHTQLTHAHALNTTKQINHNINNPTQTNQQIDKYRQADCQNP